MILRVIRNGCRANLRDILCLVFILYIRMDRNLDIVIKAALESNNRFALQHGSIESKRHIYGPVLRLWGEGLLCCDLGSIYGDRFTSGLIHQHTFHDILFSGVQVFVSDGIDHDRFLIRLCVVDLCQGVFDGGFDFWDIYGLVFVFHILMDGNIPLREANDKATEMERLLKERYGEETHISIHVEPEGEKVPQ